MVALLLMRLFQPQSAGIIANPEPIDISHIQAGIIARIFTRGFWQMPVCTSGGLPHRTIRQQYPLHVQTKIDHWRRIRISEAVTSNGCNPVAGCPLRAEISAVSRKAWLTTPFRRPFDEPLYRQPTSSRGAMNEKRPTASSSAPYCSCGQ